MNRQSNHEAEKAQEAPHVSSVQGSLTEEPKSSTPTPEAPNDVEETRYPGGMSLFLIMLALYLAMFLVALDRTIIGVAVPKITDTFHSLDDIGWYGSAYLLTSCAFQLIFGRIYTFYSPKYVFLTVIGLFELGSVLCGAAPNSITFILGRAIAGLGSAGVFSGAIVIIVHSVPLRQRPLWTGFLGGVFGVASVVGPLVGGVFTTDLSWRWCFYINLPIGAITVVLLVLILKLPNPMEKKSLRQQIHQLDPIGTFFFLPGIVCLLLALQWGGSTYPWSNGRIIALLILFVVLTSAFVAVQIWKKDTATVPPHIIAQRSVFSGVWYSAFTGSFLILLVYYLPIWFQAIKGASAVHSGVMSLPLVMALVTAAIATGGMVTRFGYYTPFIIASSVLMSIGAGLLTTFTTSTGHSKWIGYQAFCGFGIGMGMQQSSVSAQAVLAKKDVPTGVSLMFFAQSLGGAIFVSIGENVFTSGLISGLHDVAHLDPQTIVSTGATALRHVVDPKLLPAVLEAYNGAIVKVFYVAIATACTSSLGGLGMEWINIKKVKEQKDGPPSDASTAVAEVKGNGGDDTV